MDEDIEYTIDKENNFVIKIKEGNQVFIIEPSKFYKKSIFQKEGSYMIQNNVELVNVSGFDINLYVKGKSIKLFCSPLEITNSSNKKVIIYSKDHFLELIKLFPDKFKYYRTIYNSKWEKFDTNDINNIILSLNKIIFADKNIIIEESSSFFKNTKEKYDEFFKNNNTVFFIEKIDPILISVNFFKYYSTTRNKEINIIHSPDRSLCIMNILNFYNTEKKIKIKAYTGPYGIGKTFSFLMAQKLLYISQIRSLYINLKYYETLAPLDEKIETLQKECFYLFFKENEYSTFLNKTNFFPFKSVFDAIINIVKILNKNKYEYLIFLDQYQEKFFSKGNLKALKKICKKLVLISSINDTDVKLNIYIKLNKFLENIDNIPLKYINYISDGEKVKLFFAFPLIEEILKKYFKYCENINNFNIIEENEGKLGTAFEEIVSVDFKIRSLMKVYSFFDVKEISNLNEPNDNFTNLKQLYLSKKRIFIGQTNFRGPKYDMAVVLTEVKTLILIQAKYKITNKILSKADYNKEKKKILENIKNLGFDIATIHVLYFSSIDYNRDESVYNILKNKEVECYFYSIHNKKFYRDIYESYSIDDFILSDKTKLCWNYVNWKVSYNPLKHIPVNDVVKEKINLLERKFSKQINENKYDDKNLVNLYESFLVYLNNNHLCNNFIHILGMFLILSSQEYPNGIYQFNNLDYYILVCKISEFKIIFDKSIYIICHDDNSNIIYYSVNMDKRVKKNDFENNMKSEKFNYIQGYWKNE